MCRRTFTRNLKYILPKIMWLILALIFSGQVTGSEHEYRLTKYLMSNYEKSVRPIANSSNPVMVRYDVSLHQIIDVDEKNQIFTTNCWIRAEWIDDHLTWNASDFGDVNVINIPFEKVWKPDIILYNNADSSYNNAIINTNVIVYNNGLIRWLSHGIYRSSCNISVEYFPFDVQVCLMKWSSWTYDGTQLDMEIIDEEGDKSNYQENGEFQMEAYRPRRNVVYYNCCKEPYIDITYAIQLRRRPMFYVFNLILPCVLINGIALLVFYVPSESGEKVTLGISALLSMTVFLMTIRESLPPTEKTPLISMYYGVSICLVSFASAIAVVTLNIHHRGVRGNEVPSIIKKIVLRFMSRLVFLNFDESIQRTRLTARFIREREEQEGNAMMMNSAHPANSFGATSNRGGFTRTATLPNSSLSSITSRAQRAQNTGDLLYRTYTVAQSHVNGAMGSRLTADIPSSYGRSTRTSDLDSQVSRQARMMHRSSSADDTMTNDPMTHRVMEKVSSTIDRNEMRNAETDAREKFALEWKQVSLVLDRVLLLIFFLAMTIATLVILTSSPHLYSFIDMIQIREREYNETVQSMSNPTNDSDQK